MNTTRITTVGAGVLLAGSLAACAGNSGSSAPAGGGTSTSGPAAPAPTTSASAHSPKAQQGPTPGPTRYVPVPGPTQYVPVYIPQQTAPSGTSCNNSGLFAGEHTSCPFAAEVEAAYFANGGVSDATVSAYSPVTGITYSMYCTEAGGMVICTGGNDAVAEFPG